MTTARKRLVTTMMHFTTNQRKARDTHKYRDDTDNNVSGGDDGEYGDYDVDGDDVEDDDDDELLPGIKTKAGDNHKDGGSADDKGEAVSREADDGDGGDDNDDDDDDEILTGIQKGP